MARPTRRLDLLDGFTLPPELEARRPAETTGLARDEVRLMVTEGEEIRHLVFSDLAAVLRAGDLLVVNNSDTIPASVPVDDLVVNFSTSLPGGLHVVELRRRSGSSSQPWQGLHPRTVWLPGGGALELLAPYPLDSPSRRLWVAHPQLGVELGVYLARFGEPIRYPHVDAAYPLSDYQTIFGSTPGSAEMPSAGRPFTATLLAELVAAGVAVAPVTLHTGVSSLESGEMPYPEWYEVPPATVALVNHTRGRGGRVIAVGTTVVRALETVSDDRGRSHPGRGWTDLVISSGDGMRVVDGLVTGWHEPASTHLDMLEAIAGRERLVESYRAALSEGYLWHEFGDSHLILPG
ncbi:MAG: S-adenosylmethionine:tRNA ribosyltransferase-isomerase [Actinobacteria bacterium]|nr:S-adenosylmethionine:tRNA ribosyltransferase-isomerase [Actinomycetota bacterium]